MKRTKNTVLKLVMGCVAAYALAACGGEGEGGGLNDSSNPLPTSAVAVPTLVSPEELAKQSAESSGYVMKAMAMEDPAQAASGYEVQADTRLVAVQVELSNVSSADALPVDVANAIVTDAEGITYNAVVGGHAGELVSGELKQGDKANGWIAFTVPKDVALKTITYRVGIISTIALEAELPKK